MKLIKASILLLALGAAAGCKKTEAPAADTGSITFAVAAQQEVADVTRSQISDITALPAAADFTLTITDSKKQTVWSGSMGGMTEPYSLATGDYTVSAEYGSTTDEGFDKPCFTGSLAFTINGGDSKEITIPVSLANAIVKVSCTDMFNNYFTDYSFKITTASGAEIPFAKGESRGAFIDAFKFTIEGKARKYRLPKARAAAPSSTRSSSPSRAPSPIRAAPYRPSARPTTRASTPQHAIR